MAAHDKAAPTAPHLGPLETRVMEALWESQGSSIRSVIDQLQCGHAYTTIATVLGNLERKGLVESVKQGRTTRYESKWSREEHAAMVMRQALDASSDRAASIAYLLDAITSEDMAALRGLLAERA